MSPPLHTDVHIHAACFSGSTGVQVSIAYGGCVVGMLADLWILCLHRLGMRGALGFPHSEKPRLGGVAQWVQVGECSCSLGPSFGLPESLTCSLTLEIQSCLPWGQVFVLSDLLRALGEKAHVAFPKSAPEDGQGMGSTLSQGNMSLSPLLSPSMVDPDARHLLIIYSITHGSLGGDWGGGALGGSVLWDRPARWDSSEPGRPTSCTKSGQVTGLACPPWIFISPWAPCPLLLSPPPTSADKAGKLCPPPASPLPLQACCLRGACDPPHAPHPLPVGPVGSCRCPQ